MGGDSRMKHLVPNKLSSETEMDVRQYNGSKSTSRM